MEAENGFEAIEFYKANTPALTILDINMPELDGLSALKEIISFYSTAKVIMCSAVDFVAKPFRSDELRTMISKYLSLI